VIKECYVSLHEIKYLMTSGDYFVSIKLHHLWERKKNYLFM